MIIINNLVVKKIIDLIDYRICKLKKCNYSSVFILMQIKELEDLKSMLQGENDEEKVS